jgi:hypothetical protein
MAKPNKPASRTGLQSPLALRKQALLLESDRLREALTSDLLKLAPTLQLADSVWAAGHWAYQHRWRALTAALLLLMARPGRLIRLIRMLRLMRLMRSGLSLWGLCRRAVSLWQKVQALWQAARK